MSTKLKVQTLDKQTLKKKIKMTGELIILCGISGSGKSSFAKFLFDSNPQKFTIVNRDKIRELIFGYTEDSIVHYWTKTDVHKYEKEVTEYEDVLIYEGLNKGKTVIVDATHLKRSYLERFKYWNVKTSMHILFTSLEECIVPLLEAASVFCHSK